MIAKDDMMGVLLSACPSFVPHRKALQKKWRGETEDSQLYLTLCAFARHLNSSIKPGDSVSLPTAFQAIERLQIEGDGFVRRAATFGLLRNLHKEATEPERFYVHLGPISKRWWDDASFPQVIGSLMEKRGLLRISMAQLAADMGQDAATVRAKVLRICTVDCPYPAFLRRPGGLTVYNMTCGSFHLALTREQVRHLRGFASFSRRVDYILDTAYPAVRLRNPAMVHSITYAWKSIGKIIATIGAPLSHLMEGGIFLGTSRSGNLRTGLKERILFLKPPALVKSLAAALRAVSEDRVRQAVDEHFGAYGGSGRVECCWDVSNAITGLADLFENAARLKRRVVFFSGCIT